MRDSNDVLVYCTSMRIHVCLPIYDDHLVHGASKQVFGTCLSLWGPSSRYPKRFQPRIHGAATRPHGSRSFPRPRDERHTRAPPPHWKVCPRFGPSLSSSTEDFAPHFERQQAAVCGLNENLQTLP